MNWHVKSVWRMLVVSFLFFDHVAAGVTFSNDKARFVLKDWKAKVRINPSTIPGWRDSSMIPKVSGLGLGDYNLKQNDYALDTVLTYSYVCNSMQFMDWNIPANTCVHIRENIYMDGYGGTINIGENSQLFVDDNVTLTLRNVTVNSSRNGVGNPAIKLASNRSQLALDNTKLDLANDFYFDRGKFFAYNDVSFTGTNAFIYRSPVQSFITSGATLQFDMGTTFSVVPATFTACPYSTFPTTTNNNFILMTDQTSKLSFDGATFMTTATGLRLTAGSTVFDNKVNLKSKAINDISSTPFTSPITGVTSASTVTDCVWSPDGRYVLVTSYAASKFWIFYFNGVTLMDMSSGGVAIGQPVFASWSSDGKFVAIPSINTNVIHVYGVTNGVPSFVCSAPTMYTVSSSAKWSLDGKYVAVTCQTGGPGGGIQVFSFNGSALASVANIATSMRSYSLDWSPDGKFLAVGSGDTTSNNFAIYSFTPPSGLASIGSITFGTAAVYQVSWSPDGRFIAISRRSANNLLEVYSFKGRGAPLLVGSVSTGSIDTVAATWTADGRYIATCGLANVANNIQLYSFSPWKTSATSLSLVGQTTLSGGVGAVRFSPNNSFIVAGGVTGNIFAYRVNYVNTVASQAVSNSIVFGNSAMQPLSLSNKITSSYDCTIKLLSGANVSVDGILNIDNSQTNTNSVIFANDNARFVLKDWKSKIRSNLNSMQGWRDSSIVPNVSGIGLGDYNLKQYDYVPDNTITYSEVSNSMQFMDWNIPANTVVHVKENIYMDGYGGTINLGENSQLFVDDNVTLTLRNVTVSSSKNGVGNPAIKLASNRSQLALDNTKLDFANDFYFDRGKLFAYNDVNFTGTNGFIFRSTVPSYIKSGANLKFNPGTTFDFRPSTTGMPGLLGKDLLMMDDATSKITFDGVTLKSTLTGMRLTAGQILFDNKVSVSSAAVLRLSDLTATITTDHFIDRVFFTTWSPDGRYLAAGGINQPNDMYIYRFDGTNLYKISSGISFSTSFRFADWSPDGKFVAVAGNNGGPDNLRVYSFTNGSLSSSPICSYSFGTSAYCAKWSSDGRYLAVGGENSSTDLVIYSFDGSSLTQVATQSFGTQVTSCKWHPNGRYLFVSGVNSTVMVSVYSFDGTSLSLITSHTDISFVTRGLDISPDGRYVALSGSDNGTNYKELIIYGFNGSILTEITSSYFTDTSAGREVAWSADGQYLAQCIYGNNNDVIIYKFNGVSLQQVNTPIVYGAQAIAIAWHPTEKYIAVGGNGPASGHGELEIHGVVYGPETQTQAVSNSIVFGNSVLQPISLNTNATSTWDLTVKLLSGANVSVDGILNIDNSPTNTNSVIFANDNARFVLKDGKSKIRSNLNSMQGWHDSSIVPNISGIGLGDYNLKQYDYVPDNTITYSEVSNSMQFMDWNIPANTVVHIRENIYMDGYGGTINLGENSQLFVDDNVTLTLRNVTVSSSKNGVGNPAIKLASTRSQLALDNVKLDFANDFYFDCGKFFAYNDVIVTGTNSFIYRSTVPSYIKSGANLKFDVGLSSTFDYRPSGTGFEGLTAKDLLIMDDITSKITINGCALSATTTGLRLTGGQILFDNNSKIRNRGISSISSLGSLVNGAWSNYALCVRWSNDGRYVAVAGDVGVKIYKFYGGTPVVVSTLAIGEVTAVSWSPDDKYLAIAAGSMFIYKWSNQQLSLVTSASFSPQSWDISWSPDGRFIVLVGNDSGTKQLRVYSWNGINLVELDSKNLSGIVFSASWHPSGKFLAIGGAPGIIVYSFDGMKLTSLYSAALGWLGVKWSPSGRFLAAVGNNGGDSISIYEWTGARLIKQSSTNFSSGYPEDIIWSKDSGYLVVTGKDTSIQLIVCAWNGSTLNKVIQKSIYSDTFSHGYSVALSPDERYIAVATGYMSGSTTGLCLYPITYAFSDNLPSLDNAIVFGNSALTPLSLSNKITSSYDVTVKLLSGANVSVDGILNIDNSQTNTNSVQFASDNSRFVLKDWKSKIRMNQSSALGWHDSSIVPNVRGIGLGDYNLKQYDYVPDNTLTYSEVSNSMQYSDWNIPANTIVHVRENIYMDGYGGTINLGENSQLFVDDNVTLTLRNVTVSSTKNFAGNPAIQLASSRSKLALDNVKLDVMNDFYFNRGNLFVYNDVKFTGTSAFIYRSCQPSFITSGAKLIFDTGTTFSFVPATPTVCPYTVTSTYTSNNFILMSDASSGIYLNGSSFKATSTGCRLTTGQMIFDNNVSIQSFSNVDVNSLSTSIFSDAWSTFAHIMSWRSDGRYFAVAGQDTTAAVRVYYFNGTAVTELSTCRQTYSGSGNAVAWHPDGKYLATAGQDSVSDLRVYSFNGATLTALAACSKKFVTSARISTWSPDGRYLAVAGTNGPKDLIVYRFDGVSLTEVFSDNFTTGAYGVSWSPDGKYIAAVGDDTTSNMRIYRFDGANFTVLAGTPKLVNPLFMAQWSPDGKYLSVSETTGTGGVRVFTFDGLKLRLLTGCSKTFTGGCWNAMWSPDGKYLSATGSNGTSDLIVYKFDGSSLSAVSGCTKDFSLAAYGSSWSPDGKIFLVGGDNGASNDLFVYRVDFVKSADTQAVSNSIVLGNSSVSSASDITLKLLSGANVSVDGILNYDNVLGGTIFSNENARFVLKDSNSKIRLNPNTVISWRDRSLIKNLTGKGLSDYNYQTYAGADKILTYAEAPTDLVYNNSNALRALTSSALPLNNSNSVNYVDNFIRTNSNALMSWMRQSSNTVTIFNEMVKGNSDTTLAWIKHTSNAAVSLSSRIKWNSNAIVYLNASTRNNSNAIIKLGSDNRNNSNSIVSQDLKIRNNSNTIKFESDHFISANNGKITALGSISGTTNVAGRGILNSPIDLQGGTLTLNGDMILSNQTTILSSGNFDLQGNSMIFGGDLTLPSNVAIKIVSGGVLDGQGNEFKSAINSKLIVDDNVTLTLCNMNWVAAGSPQIEMRTATSRLTLQNLSTSFDRDYSFTQGQLFIQDDVFVTGTNKFSYVSTASSYVMQHSTLYFDKNTTFSYSPRLTARHTRSERNLIKLLDKTSELYFNECTLQLPDSGWQLTNGTIYFDNKTTVYGNTTQADSFEWGNGSAAGELEIRLLSGAYLGNYGYIYHNSAN